MDIWKLGTCCIMSFLAGGFIFSLGQIHEDWKEINKWKHRYYRLKRNKESNNK